jgi:DNA-binding MarR family transcriptional regulator
MPSSATPRPPRSPTQGGKRRSAYAGAKPEGLVVGIDPDMNLRIGRNCDAAGCAGAFCGMRSNDVSQRVGEGRRRSPAGLSYELYKLTARLERAADELLRREQQVTYARFLALLGVRETNGSQRDLARWLGQTEPSKSRTVTVLADDGLLEVTRLEGAGNRRQLRLTTRGAQLVERCGQFLEGRFEELVRRSGVPYEAYQRHTRRRLAQLDAGQGRDAHSQETA